MTRDEFLKDLKEELETLLPLGNEELGADEKESIETAVEKLLDDDDEADDDEEDEE